MSKKRGPKQQLSLPINKKKYTLVANQPLTINLPQPFKINDSTFVIHYNASDGVQTGNYTFKLKNADAKEIHGTVALIETTMVILKSSGNIATDDMEFTILELTSSTNIDIDLTFENLILPERMKPNQGRFGHIVTYQIV